jgi:hypothetical protein
MAMQYEPGSEKVAIMNGDGAGIPVVKSLSPVGDPEVKRTRKNLLIILIISLVSFFFAFLRCYWTMM